MSLADFILAIAALILAVAALIVALRAGTKISQNTTVETRRHKDDI